MSFLYPRKMTFYRPRTNTELTGVTVIGGLKEYSGRTATGSQADIGGEDMIAKDIQCSIQATRATGSSSNMLPANVTNPSRWHIFIPRFALRRGLLRDRDIGVDDEGLRYDLTVYWDSLGYNLKAVRLQS